MQAHCSGVETNVCALRLACDTRREMGSRLMLSVLTHAAHDSVLRWQRSQRSWISVMAQSWRERAFQGALAGLAGDFE